MNTRTLLERWERLRRLPGGRTLFSRAIARVTPYAASVRPRVLELSRGFARVGMRDRRAVHDHLERVDTAAVGSLAQLAAALALHSTLPEGARAEVAGLAVECLGEGRGPLSAECRVDLLAPSSSPLEVLVRDEVGDEVARATVRWRIISAVGV